MKATLSLGSNLGDRLQTINAAVDRINALPTTRVLKCSSAYRSPPLLPDDAPPDWYRLFLNCALVLDTQLKPLDLLAALQNIESELGRVRHARWGPRVIDIDILTYGQVEMTEPTLNLPHPEAATRHFVLAPLSEIAPNMQLGERTVLAHKRRLKASLPAWMEIVNITPDSFSGDGLLGQTAQVQSDRNDLANFIDIGAESTRPGADAVTAEEEWTRLESVLDSLDLQAWCRPRVSVDTRNAVTAARALEAGADLINDVSGLQDPGMLEVLQASTCDVAIMHHLGIPVDPTCVIPDEEDPMTRIVRFLEDRLELLDRKGIPAERVLVDPGIGFGKTAEQSWRILERISELQALGTRIVVGHSRKSFLKTITDDDAPLRDAHTLAISQHLSRRGVDVIRVHNLAMHYRFLEADWRIAGAN